MINIEEVDGVDKEVKVSVIVDIEDKVEVEVVEVVEKWFIVYFNIMIATGTEERPPTRCSLRTMGPTAGSSTLLLLLVANTLSLEAKKKLPCRPELIPPCPWLLSLSIQQDQSPG